MSDERRTLLGGLTPQRFLVEHWQKKPLLVRQAIPGFRGLLTPRELTQLGSRPGAVTRTVVERKGKHGSIYDVDEGPFHDLAFDKLPKQRFSLLVQGVEQHIDAGWDLLQRFDFIPSARVDDLMVSWAVPGAGVGPHFDAYDVFLIQGSGRRRWRVSEDRKLTRGEGRSLAPFVPTDDWVLEPGDMLYLPPRVAHWGTATDDKDNACMTYSVGFLAPWHEQLVHNFLAYLGQSANPEGLYQDPDLHLQEHPAELGDDTVKRVEQALAELRFDSERIATFTGRLLTGPKPTVVFKKPARALSRHAFDDALAAGPLLKLARPSRLLFRDARFFMNGEEYLCSPRARPTLVALADRRCVRVPAALDDDTRALLFTWYQSGFLVLGPQDSRAP